MCPTPPVSPLCLLPVTRATILHSNSRALNIICMACPIKTPPTPETHVCTRAHVSQGWGTSQEQLACSLPACPLTSFHASGSGWGQTRSQGLSLWCFPLTLRRLEAKPMGRFLQSETNLHPWGFPAAGGGAGAWSEALWGWGRRAPQCVCLWYQSQEEMWDKEGQTDRHRALAEAAQHPRTSGSSPPSENLFLPLSTGFPPQRSTPSLCHLLSPHLQPVSSL